MSKVKRIVLTGGPCAGKTTALVRIIEHFSNLGFKVFTVPEVPTLYSQGGWSYLTTNKDLYYEGELSILQTQLALEDSFMRMAETCTEPTIVVCDRGTMDISAYISPEMWEDITRKCGTSTGELRERYDAVLHLVSAADGAEEFYTVATNAIRYEKADEAGLQLARDLDKKVNRAWTGHPRLKVINNHGDFETKLQCVLKEIAQVLGLPQPVAEERKYIVEVTGPLPDCVESEITQTYLVADPDCEVRLRRRLWGTETVNALTTKKYVSPGEILETQRQVSNALYESLLQQADPYRATIRKSRQSFIWRGQHFEIDTYHEPIDSLVVLECKGTAEHEDVIFPPFIKMKEDITGRRDYYNYNIALKK